LCVIASMTASALVAFPSLRPLASVKYARVATATFFFWPLSSCTTGLLDHELASASDSAHDGDEEGLAVPEAPWLRVSEWGSAGVARSRGFFV
jgi:hypothetical protein